MQVTFQLAADDYLHGLAVWRNRPAWRRWGFRLIWIVISLLIALSLAVIAFRPSRSTLQTVGPLVGTGAVWLAILVGGPWLSARRQFRNTPSAQNPMTIDASDSGLEIHSVHSDSKVAWSAYMAWGEDKAVFVILPQPRIYVPIPKRAFTAEQQNEFRELLRRNIKPKSK
jgi:hypothetical protein